MSDGWEYLAWDLETVKRAMARWGVHHYSVIEQEPTHYPETAPIRGRKPVTEYSRQIPANRPANRMVL